MRLWLYLTLIVNSIVLAVFLLYGSYSAHRLSQLRVATIEEHTEDMARSVAAGAADDLLSQSYDKIEDQLMRAVTIATLRELAITDAEGRIIVRVQRNAAGKAQADFASAGQRIPLDQEMYHEGQSYIRLLPMDRGTRLGWVRATASLADVLELRRQIWMDALVASLLTTLLAGAVLLVRLRHDSRAMEEAARFAGRLEEQEDASLPAISRIRELRQVQEALNHASKTLAAQFRELQAMGGEQKRINGLLQQTVHDLADKQFAMDQHAIVSIGDAQGNIIYANEKLKQVCQYSDDELLGNNHRMLKSGLHDRSFYEDLWATISSGKVWHGDIANRRKDGAIYWVASTIVPMLDQDGRPNQYISIRTDITNQKKIELALAEARRRELETGSEIQRSLLLGDLPEGIHGAHLATYTEPSQGIDGDFFSITKFRPDCFELLVGDVMGKGVPAALIGAGVKSTYNKVTAELFSQRADEHHLPTPAEVVNALHHSLTPRLIELGSFVTLALYRFDSEAGTLCFVNAGHTLGLLARKDGNQPKAITGDNLPIGVLEDETYTQTTLPVESGDALLVYSDGITESANASREEFGFDRLAEILRAGRAACVPPTSLLQSIRQQVRTFVGSSILSDDQTAVMVDIQPRRKAPRGTIEQRVAPNLMVLPWRLDGLAPLRAAIADAACRLTEADVDALILGSFEAATNILRHAKPYFSDATIACRLTQTPDESSVELIYPGPTFKPPDNPTPDFSGNSEGGFGLYIIENCVDQVDYSSLMPGVSSIRLVKRRSEAPAP